ncbi:hypothetical protein GMORB2_3664 [Geosmithia morbida]|uniref:Uncharacterized protein n=1 Tax=Geosmithia morbida TaxID=1094350 RepID=A0A9P4YZB9_9HYPO|nr:uncharacterized protein GMORB2_3664 [Geosmithia morbida]KAF4124825.1 hypothetical protein GMORB2_3664 [Geosmithia morbida]
MTVALLFGASAPVSAHDGRMKLRDGLRERNSAVVPTYYGGLNRRAVTNTTTPATGDDAAVGSGDAAVGSGDAAVGSGDAAAGDAADTDDDAGADDSGSSLGGVGDAIKDVVDNTLGGLGGGDAENEDAAGGAGGLLDGLLGGILSKDKRQDAGNASTTGTAATETKRYFRPKVIRGSGAARLPPAPRAPIKEVAEKTEAKSSVIRSLFSYFRLI